MPCSLTVLPLRRENSLGHPVKSMPKAMNRWTCSMRRKPMRMRKQRNFLKRSGHPLINVKKENERRKKIFPILRPLRPGPINWKGKPVTVRHADPWNVRKKNLPWSVGALPKKDCRKDSIAKRHWKYEAKHYQRKPRYNIRLLRTKE